MNKKVKAKKIIKEIQDDLKNGDIILTHCGTVTKIKRLENCSMIFDQGGSEISYDYCDFIVTFNHFYNYKKCCVKMLQDFLPEIYGENAKPCRAMLFIKIMAKYMNGTISTKKPYWGEWN